MLANRGGLDDSLCPAAGRTYDIRRVPMALLCAGLSVDRPLEVAQNHVPNPRRAPAMPLDVPFEPAIMFTKT